MSDVHSALDALLPGSIRVLGSDPVGGGCTSDAQRVEVQQDGEPQTLFVKCNEASFIDNFECEAVGLTQLADANALRAPMPLAVGHAAGRSWLITNWVNEGQVTSGFYDRFAVGLARLHRATVGTEVGWQRDNYLGAARQRNPISESWCDFVAENRIGFQLRWAVDQGYRDPTLKADCTAIIRRMDDLLSGRADQTSLLHGDLWSGNYLCDVMDNPVLIDPATYRGCREAEFGMLKLFGACPQSFYDRYQLSWPMPQGWQRRVDIYVLYHLLNHLNLFGAGYLGQCKTLATSILQQG